MKVNPADRPKIAILVVAICLIGGYGAFTFISRKAPTPTVPGQVTDSNANLPTAAMLAEGKMAPDAAKGEIENLMTVFPKAEDAELASVNPFRSPVPKPVASNVTQPAQQYQPNQSAIPNTDITGDSFGPMEIGEGQSPATVQSISPMFVKGIIAPEGGQSEGMAFIKVGEKTKGYRKGDEVAPGVRVVSITTFAVSFVIGKSTVTAKVGQEVKPLG